MTALADRYEAFLIDLDGVVYRGDEAVPGAARAIDALRDRGRRVVFITNNSARTPEGVAEKLASFGVAAEPGDVVSSAHAAAPLVQKLVGVGASVFVVGEEGVRRALAEAGLEIVDGAIEKADAVVVGWDRTVDFEKLRTATVLVQRGARLVATNADASYPAPGGEVWPGAGALLAVIETATGIRAEVAGKPYPPLFEAALERAGTSSGVVVGDRIETDIAGAAGAGLDAVAVLSGASGPADLLDHDDLPVDVVAALDGVLADRPDVRPRDATAADQDAVAGLVRAAGLQDPPGGSHVVVLGDAAATAAVRVDGGDAYLHSVAVAPEHRGLGVGTLSMAAVARAARRSGASAAYLLTEEAEGFFAALGFEAVARDMLPAWMKPLTATCAETAVAMRRSLRR